MEDIFDQIEKPVEEQRVYRYFKLSSNGLRVVVIHDPVAVKSAASVNVNVGHWSDPSSHPGIAHFCEHMLFMGTTKYPNESHFSSVLSEHGGTSNAYTAHEDTNYYFDVTHDHFEESLDIFSRFFIDPIMHESATERELLAVDSEFNNCINQDYWRYSQIRCNAANPLHPASKFGTGNKKTLSKDDTRDELLKFHKKYYKASRMSLCILSNDPIEKLCDMVLDKFSEIDDTHNGISTIPKGLPIAYGKDQVCKIYHIVPKKDYRTLRLLFPLPSLVNTYKKQADGYLSHLIGHESLGSICYILQSNGWSTGLECGDVHSSSVFMLFGIDISLSPLGEEHIDDIIQIIFTYIKMLEKEDYPQWIFEECKQINNIAFRYSESTKPIKHVSSVAEHMSSSYGYDREHILSGAYHYGTFDKDLIKQIASLLIPENLIIFLSSKQFEGKTDKIDEWYGTHYSVFDISQERIEKWKIPADVNVHLPSINHFIPSNFDIISTKSSEPAFPHLIRDDEYCKIWFKQDDTFMTPKANLLFQIITPVFQRSPLDILLGQLLIRIINEDLSEITYNASVAGVNFVLEVPSDIHIYIYGYSECLERLADTVFSYLTSFSLDSSDSTRMKVYQSHKDKLYRKYQNYSRSQAYEVAQYAFQGCTNERFTIDQRIAVFNEITPEILQDFANNLYNEVKIQSLVHGNITEESALKINEKLLKVLKCKPLLKDINIGKTVKLPSEYTTIFEEEQIDKEACNSAIYYYFQLGSYSVELDLITTFFGHIVSEPAFDELRTKQQLGYLVWFTVRTISGTKGAAVVIQSPSYDPVYLQYRSYEFLNSFIDTIKNFSEETYNAHIEGLITIKQQKHRELLKESNTYWTEIIACRNQFNKDKLMIEQLKELKRETVINFAENLLHNTPRIIIRVFPNGGLNKRTSEDNPNKNSKEFIISSIKERDNWKNNLEYYPNPAKKE